MPLYTYKCELCETVTEDLVKLSEYYNAKICKECGGPSLLVLSTPSAPQWNCHTAHSRSKGF